MAKKEERREDLNPRSEDVDEKIRRLLDPSEPDEGSSDKKEPLPKSSIKITGVDVKKPIKNEPEETGKEQTAPELETSKKRGKIVVPVSHDSDEEKSEETEQKEEEEPESKPVVQIAIDDPDESREDVEKKLDEAIADLDNKKKTEEEAETPKETQNQTEDSEDTDNKADEKKPNNQKKIKVSHETDDELPESDILENPETEEAVVDIVAEEGDQLLETTPAKKKKEPKKAPEKPKKPRKKLSFKKFFSNKAVRIIILGLLFIGLIVAFSYPKSRYKILNFAGVKSKSSLTIIDLSSQQPLKNVSVSLAGETVTSGADGTVNFENLSLGDTKLKIERIAFASIEEDVTIGWGSNPFGEYQLKPTGAQYKIQLNDFLSDKPIGAAEIDTKFASASADSNGLVTLTLPPLDEDEIELSIVTPNQYRQENISLKLSQKETLKVKLVPAKKHVFISKRTGKYDVYSIYADGKDERLVLAASGSERSDLSLNTHPKKNVVGYVSTRAGKQNNEGFLLSDLVILDVDTGVTTPVANAEKIQMIGWWGNKLVYVTTASGESALKPDRTRLLSYDEEQGTTVEIAKANYFNDIVLIDDYVYYAPSGAYTEEKGRFYKALIDNASRPITLFDGEVWNFIRLSYDELALSVGEDWYSYILGEATATERSTAPVNTTDRIYVTNFSAKFTSWVDQRDGKGVLLGYNIADKTEQELATASGLKTPLTWLNATSLVYRVEAKDETADYIISIHGGAPKKITDVTSSSVDEWYFH